MTLDVFADIACPWCYIGEARLQAALAARPGLGVERRWRPFQLQPGLPRTGTPRDAFFERKFGGGSQMEAAFAHVAAVGREDGLRFDFARLAGAPNTTDAHRLVLLGETHGRAFETADALFEGYFGDGRDLNDVGDLVAIAEHAGLPGADALAVLEGDRFETEVAQSQEVARRSGIGGVPLYLFGDQFALSGAQPVQAFVQALDQAAGQAAGQGAAASDAADPDRQRQAP